MRVLRQTAASVSLFLSFLAGSVQVKAACVNTHVRVEPD